jgi:hypothetical protein
MLTVSYPAKKAVPAVNCIECSSFFLSASRGMQVIFDNHDVVNEGFEVPFNYKVKHVRSM